MAFEPNRRQALAMFSLVFASTEEEQRPMQSAWLKEASERRELEKAKLIELVPEGRCERVTLTEEGWEWAAANLNADLPERNPAARVLQGVLRRLGSHLEAEGTVLAHFAGMHAANDQNPAQARGKPMVRSPATRHKRTRSKPSARSKPPTRSKSPANSKPRARSKPATRSNPKTVTAKAQIRSKPPSSSQTAPGLSERIRNVALELGKGSARTRVRLRDLRARLSGVPREQLDRELLELQRSGALVLYRIDDPMDVTKDDEKASLQVAGYPRHILYLER